MLTVCPARAHYENAFAAYLDRHGVPHVPVAERRAAVGGRLGIKAFDYLVYPREGRPCLVDVKGRKFPSSLMPARRRWENWVTQEDVDGLGEWRGLFGAGHEAAFVFAYWVPEATPRLVSDPDFFVLAGRVYTFWGVGLDDYARHARTRSARWRTVHLPAEAFARHAWPLTTWLRAA